MGSEAIGEKQDNGGSKFDWELFLCSPLFFEIKRIFIALLLFAGSTGLAYALYSQTLPEGLPWGVDPRWPDGWKWAALSVGLLSSVVNRYLGWRVGLAAALFWTVLPFVWNGAILGTQESLTASRTVAGIWIANAVFLWATRKARWIHFVDADPTDSSEDMCGFEGWRRRLNGIVAWAVLGVSVLFVIVALWWHDYQLGEPASAYARDIVALAGDRVIVMNGICDEHVEQEAEKVRGAGHEQDLAAISLVRDEEYRKKVAAWAKREWPDETNLWVAAQVGVEPMLTAAVAAHPERFYVMNGGDETLEQWERRWTAFAPCLRSSDPFVRVARRAFAYQGNAIANAMREEAEKLEKEKGEGAGKEGQRNAWRLYKRICTEIERGNIAALVNMSEMIRCGFVATEQDKLYVRERVTAFLSNDYNRRHAGEIARTAGPVKSDHELIARMSELAKERLTAERLKGVRRELTEEEKALIEQNNVMIRAANRGDWAVAGHLARKILAQPQWSGFLPANAVMGDISAMSGDYVSGEAFYRIATSRTNETPVAVWNNFADTLMHLGKLDEAEAIVRRSIARKSGASWFPRITLAEILTQKAAKLPSGEREAVRAEVRRLVDEALGNAPANVIRRIRDEERSGVIMK